MSENRNPSYCPAVVNFEINDPIHCLENNKNKRVIVIGGGCAGLAAAWHLKKSNVNVKLFESDTKLGGHANTIHVDGIDVDTGFMVYNAFNYPHLMSFFEELNVKGEDTSMGFSVSTNNGKFEYAAGETLSHLFATRSNLWNPYFYFMLYQVLRFNTESKKFLNEVTASHPDHQITVEQFLTKHKFSTFFTKNYLIPMTAAIWSSSNKSILTFPAITLFTFLNNHLLLQITGNLTWKTPLHRSQEYVKKIEQELGSERIVLNKHIVKIQRILLDNKTTTDIVTNIIQANHFNNTKLDCEKNSIHMTSSTDRYMIKITDSNGQIDECDEVIFACHPDQIVPLFNSTDLDDFETINLKRFIYSKNDTYVHTDESLMPKSKYAWTCWNYISYNNNTNNTTTPTSNKNTLSTADVDDARPVYVTYWLNKLQNLKHPRNIFVSLNPQTPPKAESILAKLNYTHPQYSPDSVKAQQVSSCLVS